MKRTVGFLFGLVCTFLMTISRPAAAADAAPMNWSQFQIDPEPGSRTTLREKLEAHLIRVDRSLAVLRAFCRQPERGWPVQRLSSTQCFERIQDAWKYFSTTPADPAIAACLGPIDELVNSLLRSKDIASLAHEGKQLTPEIAPTLQTDHGLIKMMRRQSRALAAATQPPIPVNFASSKQRGIGHRPALIVHSTDEKPSAQVHLAYPIGAALWKLSTLRSDQRAEFIRSIIDDHESAVVEILPEPGCEPESPSYFVLIAKEVELPDGQLRTVHLPFRSTTERVETEGWKNVLRILTNTSTDVRVTVRNTLLTEVFVTTDLSISACESVISFAPALDQEHRGQTAVTYGADVELTFYGHLSSRIRDVSFRSVAVSKSNVSLERAKQRGASRTSDQLAQMISAAAERSPIRPEF